MPLDKRAIKILIDTYWSSAGWRQNPTVTPEDFAYAKSNGVMFDPIRLSHDEAIGAALRAANEISGTEVVGSFIASLGSRRLDLRSGLASYAVVRNMREHKMMPATSGRYCTYCGYFDTHDIDLNILNFERIKWGGIRHNQPTYIAFDLETLRKTSRPSPQSIDFAILHSIVNTTRSMPPAARLRDLDKALAKLLPSNSAERRVLIGILGYIGILVDPARPDFRLQFVPLVEREHTPWHKDDWPYPVQWWNGSHGANQAAIDHWFPGLMIH